MDNKGNNNQHNNNNKNGMTLLIFILAALVVLFIASMISSGITRMTNQKVTYTQFLDMVEDGKVAKVEFKSGLIDITPKTERGQIPLITYYAVQLQDEELLPLLREHDVEIEGIQASATSNFLYNILSFVIPIAICWILLAFVMRRMGGGGGVMGVGKSNAKVYVEKQTGVTFKDVAGQDEAKESLQEVVDFLHNPTKYTDIGAKLPKGALLVGPPGTGKTLLAKAVAGEAKVPFFSLAGSDFVEMFVGVGASRVRDLFKEAQKNAPCIVFIDEIDAIGKSRDTRYGGNDEREQTLNQLLAEMDGFDSSKGVLILAATNRPEVLDKALLRPGRFDRRIIVDKPDLKGRKETLRVHSKNVLMDDSVDLDAIALATSGAVGSDLANMINEAAINAVKSGRKYVNQSDLFESVEVVIAGKEKKDRIMGPKEKKLVAYHEVGHALVTALQKDAEPVQKITIIPRTKGALGYTMQVPEEEKFLMTKNELVAHLVTYMGGRAAEEIVFDSVTTGASNDIEQATKIARAMVTQYGMSEKFGLMGLVTIENQYLDGRASLNCGEETAAQIDKEVMGILQESYAEAKRLLLENRSVLDEISEYLYEHETITGKEFMDIFRRLKGIPEEAESADKEKESHINFKVTEPKEAEKDSEGSEGDDVNPKESPKELSKETAEKPVKEALKPEQPARTGSAPRELDKQAKGLMKVVQAENNARAQRNRTGVAASEEATGEPKYGKEPEDSERPGSGQAFSQQGKAEGVEAPEYPGTKASEEVGKAERPKAQGHPGKAERPKAQGHPGKAERTNVSGNSGKQEPPKASGNSGKLNRTNVLNNSRKPEYTKASEEPGRKGRIQEPPKPSKTESSPKELNKQAKGLAKMVEAEQSARERGKNSFEKHTYHSGNPDRGAGMEHRSANIHTAEASALEQSMHTAEASVLEQPMHTAEASALEHPTMNILENGTSVSEETAQNEVQKPMTALEMLKRMQEQQSREE